MSWLLVAARVADDLSRWLGDLFAGNERPLTPTERAAVTRVEANVDELISEFRSKRNELAKDARRLFQSLGRIPTVLKWDEGLKADWSTLIMRVVQQAERFGDGMGAKKRRFAVELVVRVIERYNYQGAPFLPSIERAFVNPIAGIMVDWSVAVLNLHNVWPKVTRVKFPSIFQGSYGFFFKFAFWLAAVIVKLREWFFLPSKYERQIRSALRAIEPDVQRLLRTLPPNRLRETLEELASILAELGQVTAPYVRLIDRVLRLGDSVTRLTVAERQEAGVRVLRRLLQEAYADDPFALVFIDSPLGDSLLRALVEHTTWILFRNGLLPTAAGWD